MANIFYRIAHRLHKGSKDFLDIPVGRERKFLESLPEPVSDMQRSYNQYLCQNFYKHKIMVWALNAVSAILMPFAVVFLLAKGIFRIKENLGFDAECDLGSFKDVVPEALQEEYRIDYDHWFHAMSLSFSDIPFLLRVCAFRPLSCFFALKCVLKVGYYSDMIRRYSLKAVITHNEYAFSSTVLTAYCENRGVEHINVMHGEKLYYIRDSFFRFSQSYVWDEHYKDLFISLRADAGQFVIYEPRAMKIDVDKYVSPEDYADVKYYLQIYNRQQLEVIVDSMQKLQQQGYTVKYRPHPRYSDIAMLEELVGADAIEYPSKVTTPVSVANVKFAAGSFTTVLNQAYTSGKCVVLDDITFPERVEKLSARGYIFSSQTKNCFLLSKLVGENEENNKENIRKALPE